MRPIVNPDKHAIFEFGEYRLEPRRRLLGRRGECIPLTAKAFDALVHLVEHAGELVTRAALAEALWPSTVVEENNLSQAISVLRRTLGEGYIATVARRGYQFTAEVRALPEAAFPAADHEPRPLDPGAKPAAVPPPARTARAFRLVSRPAVLGAGAAVAVVAAVVALSYRADRARNALDDYTFAALTEYEGAEEHAAISRDGRYVAFLREQDGVWDAWVGQIGTGIYRKLTAASMGEVHNPAVRTLGFSPDGADVMVWTKITDASGSGPVDGGWAIPVVGGVAQPYLRGIAELDWSPDGRQIVYHTSAAGDPMFVADANERESARPIHTGEPGIHNHFPVWSRDGRFIYFVRGVVPDEMDVWRIRPTGGEPERLTFRNTRVLFPTPLDERTLLYLATAADGSGPWLHALDTERRESRRIDTRGQEYTSLAASADGRRLVATEVRPRASLWRVKLRDGIAAATDATRLEIPTSRGSSPRIGPGFVVFRAPRAATDGIWKIAADGTATELWSGADGRATAGPAVAPDGRRIAFPAQRGERTQLYVMNADGGDVRRLAEHLDVRGAPAWSPDGDWIAIGALHDGVPRLLKIPLDGGAPAPLGETFAVDPAWSPSGEFLVFAGADVGTNFTVGAVSADGTPHAIPALLLSRGSGRFAFLAGRELIVLKGNLSHKEFWAVDLSSGRERQLTDLGPGETIRDFDVADDGRELVFDRLRTESDIVLIESR